MKLTFSAPFGVVLLLAACSGQPQSEEKTAPATEEAQPSAPPIELTAIGEGELPSLQGELGCSFTIEGQDGPALVVKADVGPDATAFGAYKTGGQVRRVAGPGGFAALEKGMELSGRGMRLTVERLGEVPNEEASEATSYSARLAANRPYGGERDYEGVWTCGP